jgi:hypothetical protein
MNSKAKISFELTPKAKLDKLGIKMLPKLDQARVHTIPTMRLEQARKAAQAFREQMLNDDEKVVFYHSLNLIRAPYPTKYGLLNANTVKSPFMHILNRVFVVQYQTKDGIKTLLFSPSDFEANQETPYFKRMLEKYGALSPLVSSFLAPVENTVEQALEKVGLKPEDIDYISYDHLHTQDIRKWLGDGVDPGYFPNAKLLVMKQEWDSTTGLLPQQRDWYCPNGIEGVPEERVILLDTSVQLSKSVALVRTPGHTEGNHSLVAHTDDGILVTSENGVSADSYSPMHSEIPGVRDYAKATGMEVILNGNTLEDSLDQYISMVMEKTIAGPAKDNPDFYNFVPSSELTPYWGFPGLKPTFAFGELVYGSVHSGVGGK